MCWWCFFLKSILTNQRSESEVLLLLSQLCGSASIAQGQKRSRPFTLTQTRQGQLALHTSFSFICLCPTTQTQKQVIQRCNYLNIKKPKESRGSVSRVQSEVKTSVWWVWSAWWVWSDLKRGKSLISRGSPLGVRSIKCVTSDFPSMHCVTSMCIVAHFCPL